MKKTYTTPQVSLIMISMQAPMLNDSLELKSAPASKNNNNEYNSLSRGRRFSDDED